MPRRCAGYCRSPLRPTTPPTWILTLDQQRAKRSLRLSARANGMWAITGMLDEVDGAILAETWHRSPAPGHPRHHHPGPARADALTDMSKAAAANTHPGGCPRCPSWWIWRTCPPVTTRDPGRRHPPGRRFSSICCRAAVCTVIFGIKRKGTFIPLALGRNDAGHPRLNGALTPATGLHPLRTDPRHCHAHHIITGKTAAEPTCQTWPSLFEMSQRPTPRPVHHHHGHPHHPRHHPHPRTPETTGPPGPMRAMGEHTARDPAREGTGFLLFPIQRTCVRVTWDPWSELLTNIGVVLLFTLIGGFFAAAETALGACVNHKWEHLVAHKGGGVAGCPNLVSNPEPFWRRCRSG